MAEFVQDAFMSASFRVYTGSDAVGAELGAALKNVIALCAGVTPETHAAALTTMKMCQIDVI